MDNRIRMFKKLRVKRQLLLAELRFLVWCRDVRLFPRSVEIKTAKQSERVRRAILKANLNLMRAVIKDKRSVLASCEVDLYLMHMEMTRTLTEEEWRFLDSMSFGEATRQHKKKEEKLLTKRWLLVHRNNATGRGVSKKPIVVVKKISRNVSTGYSSDEMKLMRNQCGNLNETTKMRLAALGLMRNNFRMGTSSPTLPSREPPPLGKALVNLSSTKLTEEQEAILKKGPKFAMGPKRCDGTLLAAHVEKALSTVLEPQKTLLRAKIISLCQNMPLQCNREWKVLNAINQLDVIRMKADKGETIVLMDKNEFNDKVTTELNGGAYKKMKKDPTATTTTKLQALQKSMQVPALKNSRVLDPVAPRLFCQVKLHKQGRPLRLIVSARNSPTSKLEKAIANVIGKYARLNPSCVKNSEHLVQCLKTTPPPGPDETFLSLDIVQLFPNLPREETLEAVNKAMLEDESVPVMLRQEVISAIVFVFEHSFFRYGGNFYQQIKGSPIGSSLSPVLAEIFLIELEKKAKNLIDNWPRVFLRYVDDHLVMMDKNKINEVVRILNSICKDIQYTVEEPTDGCLPFLDVKISTSDNKITTTVYRKPTASGILINNKSLHHPSHKASTWNALVHRAYTVCSTDEALLSELQYLKELATLNDFPQHVIDKAVKRHLKKKYLSDNISLLPVRKFKAEDTVVLPFMGKISSSIGQVLRTATGKKVAFQPLNKIGDCIFNSKDPKTRFEASGIYKVFCECGGIYVGQTARNFGKRLSEHKAAVKNFQPGSSAIARHFWTAGCDKGLKWEESKVVIPNKNPWILKIREAFEIILERSRNQELMMNDEEHLNYLELWKSVEGSWLLPKKSFLKDGTNTVPKLRGPSVKVLINANEQIEGEMKEGGIEKLSVHSLKELQGPTGEQKEEGAAEPPAGGESWRGRLRPR